MENLPSHFCYFLQGNFAKYYLSISAGSSGLHAGMYEPSKQDLQNIRDNIINNTAHGVALRNLVNYSLALLGKRLAYFLDLFGRL